MPSGSGPNQTPPSGGKPRRQPPPSLWGSNWIWLLILGLAAVVIWFSMRGGPSTIAYSDFVHLLKEDHLKEVVQNGDRYEGEVKDLTKLSDQMKEKLPTGKFITERLSGNDQLIHQQLDDKIAKGLVVSVKPTYSWLWWGLLWLAVLLLIFFFFLARARDPLGGSLSYFTRSQARRYERSNFRVTFDDVAGMQMAKSELQEVVEFLRNPEKFQRLGARLPKGVLLIGPPGTGKTLLARAVAGEARVPFYSISGSEFIQMFVGVGASRVRDLFKTAKENAPCLIFIDEIDAIGRMRGVGIGGGSDEREQTLNQILSEMDGFHPNDSVVVIAATNRAEILDPALLRPGRFTRHVETGLPNEKERVAILKVHTRTVPLHADVDLDQLARSSDGMSGADLANLVNEAALLATRQGCNKVAIRHFVAVRDKVDTISRRGQEIAAGMKDGSPGDSFGLGFLKSEKREVQAPETLFRDIAGYPQVKQELAEVVAYLRSPGTYHKLGIDAPRNVLLVGPPGTGKTMFARATARAAGARILYASGASFDQMLVGVGSMRVRDLFKDARADRPTLIFIDEIDALARKRTANPVGSHRDQDATLNELLTQLDGFTNDRKHTIAFVAATNREDMLDSAFVQRMKRRIEVPLPCHAERKEILQKHARRLNLDWDDGQMSETATLTAGYSGRELANLIAESGRQTLLRLLSEARSACRNASAGVNGQQSVLPDRSAAARSPVAFGGQCERSTEVLVRLWVEGAREKQEHFCQAEDDHDVWSTLIHLEPGTYNAEVETRQSSGSTTERFQFRVGNEVERTTFDDVRRALGRQRVMIPRPEDVLDAPATMDRYLDGNDNLKWNLAVWAATHYGRVRAELEDRRKSAVRSALLVTGPRESGKTLLCSALAAVLNVPYAVCDVESLLASIDPRQHLLRRLIESAGGDVQRARYGIICIEKLDHLFAGKGDNHGMGWNVLARTGLISLLNGDRVDLTFREEIHGQRDLSLETEGILLFLEGSLPQQEPSTTPSEGPAKSALERLREAGWPAPLLSRVSTILVTDVLSLTEWQDLLQRDEEANPLLRKRRVWKTRHPDVRFDPEGYEELARALAGFQKNGGGVNLALEQLTLGLIALRNQAGPLTVTREWVARWLGLSVDGELNERYVRLDPHTQDTVSALLQRDD